MHGERYFDDVRCVRGTATALRDGLLHHLPAQGRALDARKSDKLYGKLDYHDNVFPTEYDARDVQQALDWMRGGALAMAPAPPPLKEWPGGAAGASLGGRVLQSALEPASVLQAVNRFFHDQVVPNDMASAEAWTLRGTAFVDFIALGVEVRLYAGKATATAGATGATMIVFKHTTANDVVRFGNLFALAEESLRSQGLPIQSPQNSSLAKKDSFDLDFDFDFDDMDEEPWSARMEPLLQDVDSKRAATREEAWQTLASWGKTRPDCRRDLACGLFEGRTFGLIAKALEAGSASKLAELYPMVVALKYAAPAFDEVGADKNLLLLLEKERTHLHILVQTALSQALSYISSVDDGYRSTFQGDGDRSTWGGGDRSSWGADRSTFGESRYTADSNRPTSHSFCPPDDFLRMGSEPIDVAFS